MKPRKYLTEITDKQRAWIGKAAKELVVRHPMIVQMALDRLMAAGDLERIKQEIHEQRKQKEIEEIESRIKELISQKHELMKDEVEVPA